ncbi:hypothetical protein VOLCADRAFT_93536 [Volvox carteri f. nagariensis]|uniref:Uncharacterized protein n=1 Tax=Volvox carteri f. nagariensis TaxID=3068 RepID=D8U2D6_VOLCA|nr:uncharacterized protein VOLCADRAFT_93536 [Volvox carteri f. nagariensis]EFJ46114.1 hypothetical protein VOLCADRAFT_93536 [Volvox carteri f. nagariensis]|eukprot:XP_002952864.1 hypothetical protein VOLCADRAFT_93536 [Volvox carteri f. nagariensis]
MYTPAAAKPVSPTNRTATSKTSPFSPTTRAAAAPAGPALSNPNCVGVVNPGPGNTAAVEHQPPVGAGYHTPGAAPPLRGVRTPVGHVATAAGAAGRVASCVLGTPKDVALGTPKDVALGTPKDVALGTPKDVALGTPKDVALGTPKDVALGTPGNVALGTPGGVALIQAASTYGNFDMFRSQGVQGRFHFTTAAAQHLPVLMACHLPPALQRLLRHFTDGAQCAITARAMALYARTSQYEYFRDQRYGVLCMRCMRRAVVQLALKTKNVLLQFWPVHLVRRHHSSRLCKLEAAVTEARSRNPPQDRYYALSQEAVRLTGRKRKPPGLSPLLSAAANTATASPALAACGGSDTGSAAEATAAAAAAPLSQPAGCIDVDMDAGGWAFVGGATLHCPGGGACRKAGRHENWLLSDTANGRVMYLPVLYNIEERSAVLLPLEDPWVGGGCSGYVDPHGKEPQPHVWFRYEYESRGGRRGHNFWDRGFQAHLEQAIRDVAGDGALHGAKGA